MSYSSEIVISPTCSTDGNIEIYPLEYFDFQHELQEIGTAGEDISAGETLVINPQTGNIFKRRS